MEQKNSDLLNDFHSKEPRINPIINEQLSEASKWARFISIVGFVMLSIYTIAFLVMAVSAGYTGIGGGITAFFVTTSLLMFIAGFFPTYFLFRFGSNVQNGVETASQDYMEKAFQNLKLFFRITGVMLAISIGLVIIGVVIGSMS